MKCTTTLTIAGAVALALGLAPLAMAQTAPGNTPAPPATMSQSAQSPTSGTHKAATPTMPAATASKAEIKQAQKALAKLGYNLVVDGRMGSQTRQDLRQFQKVNGLAQTGRLDIDTRRGLGLIGGQPPAGLNLSGYTTATVQVNAASPSAFDTARPQKPSPDSRLHQSVGMQSKMQPALHRAYSVPTMPLIKLMPLTLGTYKLVTYQTRQ